ncbi:MAG: hypothetical protein J0L92_36930, partial [Deltaproteobacteria bacterium]|nr:hypothetical protein [Deltaproteobacteria bacterium]
AAPGSATPSPGPVVPPTPRSGFVQIAVGLDVTCALSDDHAVRCWGSNADGRAGLGGTLVTGAPMRVEGLPDVTAIAVGDTHACALDVERHVHCWGDNRYGMLGDGTTTSRPTPSRIEGLDDVVELDAARSHTCARHTNGTVHCWGRAMHVGAATRGHQLTPIAVPGVTDAIEVVLGPENGCVLREDHTAMCWGFGGGGVFSSRPGPFARATPTFLDRRHRPIALRSLALGDRHVCLHFDDDHLECAGENENGQLTNQFIPDEAQCDRSRGEARETVTCTWSDPRPTEPDHGRGLPRRPEVYPPPPITPMPVHTETFDARTGFVVGYLHARVVVADGQYAQGRTCVIDPEERVACFGRPGPWDWGHRRPTPMPLTQGAVQLDVAPHHGCTVLRDGRAVCWGGNGAGQLGDGTTEPRHDGVYVSQ